MQHHAPPLPRPLTPRSPDPSQSPPRLAVAYGPTSPRRITFDPTYPQIQVVPEGIGRISEDAWEFNDRPVQFGQSFQGSLNGEDQVEEEDLTGGFESITLNGASIDHPFTNNHNHNHNDNGSYQTNLIPTGPTLSRSSLSSPSPSPSPRSSSPTHPIPKLPFLRKFSSTTPTLSSYSHSTPSSSTRASFSPTLDPRQVAGGGSGTPTLSFPWGRGTGVDEGEDEDEAGHERDRDREQWQQGKEPGHPHGRIHAPPAIPHSANPMLQTSLPNGSVTSPNTMTSFGLNRKRTSLPSSSAPTPIPTSTTTTTSTLTSTSTNTPTTSTTTSKSSMLDKVRNHTRQLHLPPKSREEDEKHLKSWKGIMQESRELETKKRQLEAIKRREKETRLALSIPIWESNILTHRPGEWKDEVRKDEKVGTCWFQGVPGHLRGKVWTGCIGNALALSKESYKAYSYRARKAIESDRFPTQVQRYIEDDSIATLPTTRLFGPKGPMREELKELLSAWYVSRVDEGMGYVRGVHLIAGMLLMNMNIAVAFICLRNLLDRPCLRAFYCSIEDEVEAYYRIFDNLQADLFPKVYSNCKSVGVRVPSTYFTTLFLHQLPFEAAVRVWDLILLEGDSAIFRIALAILSILEPRLYFPDKKEIQSVFDGRNAATLAIVAREKERARQKGIPYEADVDGVLTPFGVEEDVLFDVLAHDGWKESRFERLLVRELPE